jgi:hypothetical protein
MAQLKIVARFRDGRISKGTTSNFAPESPMFHVQQVGAKPTDPPVPVAVGDLKALFVVRDFAGRPDRHVSPPRPSRAAYGQRLRVTFWDGEVLDGVSLTYDAAAQGFFLFPADPDSNNERIFVVNAAVASVRQV